MEVEWWAGMVELANKPAVMETFVDILVCIVPIWVAVMIGLMIGWSWRPRWTGIVVLGLRSKLNRLLWTAPPGFGARRLWFAFTALSAFSVGRRLWRGRARKVEEKGEVEGGGGDALENSAIDSVRRIRSTVDIIQCITGNAGQEKKDITENDLEYFLQLLEGKDADMAWQSMMERSTSNMTYQAWRHEAETGPPGLLLRSRTVFEDATPELVRDFFWDDEFRPKWDPLLAYVKVLHENPQNGFMIAHWIKKFPFFCSDREYIIGKRMWESGRAYYCLTKSVPYTALPKRDKPRRVDVYFSSWVIRPVESQKREGQFPACEVTLMHYEDMGIPKDIAKLGVRHGMWGTVKKLHAGFRAYQSARKTDAAISRCASMARIATKLSGEEYGESEPVLGSEQRDEISHVHQHGTNVGIDWKWVVVGGAVALVGLQTGLIGKALLIGAGQRIGRRRSA